jgi:hypothetical protein
MANRTRKIVGSLGILAWLAFYIWAATAIAGVLPDHWAAWLAFYPIAGLGWGVPLIPLLSWMGRGRV